MSASIEDVARRAKVSISTVSRVINRRNLVNRETRKRVENAIEELGYRPNVFARGLMLKRSNILGLVLPDLHGEFYSEMMRGAQLKAREFGYQLLVSSVAAEEDGRQVLDAVTTQGLVDGIAVMLSERHARIKNSLVATQQPVVVLEGESGAAEFDAVAIDNSRGAEEVASRLLEAHPQRRLVFIGGGRTNFDTAERLNAFRRVMDAHGREFAPDDITYLDYTYASAKEFAAERMAGWADSRTMVFAANDEMAVGVIDAAIDAGIDVPGVLPVAGFDDTRIARLTRPRLTTVRVPQAEMGATAVELLCKRLRDPERPYSRVALSTKLVVRESCGSG